MREEVGLLDSVLCEWESFLCMTEEDCLEFLAEEASSVVHL